MKNPSAILAALATELHNSLPDGPLKLYCAGLAMYLYGELAAMPTKPKNQPYYGSAFAAALNAAEIGWDDAADTCRDLLRAAVNNPRGGVLQAVKPFRRNKDKFLQMREAEQAQAISKRRKMKPWDSKNEPDFEVETPWDGKA